MTVATAMETVTKVSEGDKGDENGDNGGGLVTVTRVEGKGQWQGQQERLRWQKEGNGVEEGNGEGGKSDGDDNEGGG